MPWNANESRSLEIPIGRIAFDTVRVDILGWHNHAGGFAEIEVIKRGKNLALGKPVTASGETSRYAASKVVDGIQKDDTSLGFWLASPDDQPAWIEITVASPEAEKPAPQKSVSAKAARSDSEQNGGVLKKPAAPPTTSESRTEPKAKVAGSWQSVAATEQEAAKGLLNAYKRVRSHLARGLEQQALGQMLDGEFQQLKIQLAADTAQQWRDFFQQREVLEHRLTDRDWYFYWENANRDTPKKFLLSATAQPKPEWSLEPRWVMQATEHYFIRTFDGVVHGFHIPTGRQVGMFADAEPLLKLSESDAAELEHAAEEADRPLIAALAPHCRDLPADCWRVGLFAERQSVARQLAQMQWFEHWEEKNRNMPARWFSSGQKADGSGKPVDVTWSLHRMWVLNHGGHLLVPIDENNWRGFFIGSPDNGGGSGRQVGLFADEPPRSQP